MIQKTMPSRLYTFAAASLIIATLSGSPQRAWDAPSLDFLDSPSAVMPVDSIHVDLSAHEWEHRLLLVFAPSLDADVWTRQREMWTGLRDGFAERDLRLYVVGGVEGARYYVSPDGEPIAITDASRRMLRERFSVESDAYTVVLVGKDGTEKRREASPVAADVIFETIDAMPMRRAEMRRAEMRRDGGRN